MTRTAQDAFQNVQKFTVVDNDGFVEAVASFIYRGHLIAFSTMGYSKAIACNAVLVTGSNGNGEITKEFDSVESAIVNINSWLSDQNAR